jgi:(E)-4-hydroxy-3-methylbut-2-enyl-diphosphate synthase
MEFYCESLTQYKRLKTLEVKAGELLMGNYHPIRIQTMTTTDTMDTIATVEQSVRCIEAGSELIRITAPSKNEAENLFNIKKELRKRGYNTPIVADIHFTPNAAEIAARIVEKVRVNPGNYVDKKKFENIEYTDSEYMEEIDRIRQRFTPLIYICKEYGTAMRIGTNHGSLSDRIMSRYGDTPMGMVESAMEFLRIARDESYNNIMLSMKSSNPLVMVQAYRLLVKTMWTEFGECYPLHLGVTEAGDGEDGRIKSAVGIGTLLEDGLGDTIRVSLTEDPEFEIPVCRDLVKRYAPESSKSGVRSPEFRVQNSESGVQKAESIIAKRVSTLAKHEIEDNTLTIENGTNIPAIKTISYDPFSYKRRKTFAVDNIGSHHVPVVISDLSKIEKITASHLKSAGYTYDELTDKWIIGDAAADYIFTGHQVLDFSLPGTLKVIVYPATWNLINSHEEGENQDTYFPIFQDSGFAQADEKSERLNFVMINANDDNTNYANGNANKNANGGNVVNGTGNPTTANLVNDDNYGTNDYLDELGKDKTVVICLSSTNEFSVAAVRRMYIELMNKNIQNPVIHLVDSNWTSSDEHMIHFSTECGSLLIDGLGDGICLGMTSHSYNKLHNQNFLTSGSIEGFINNTAFGILQATRTRISKTEYISCPSCGRTLFDLQETTARIRAVTNHLKGLKIAIMGCIVNGPGEMADADFGYVGSGPGKITLYKGKDIIKRNVSSEIAVQELINILKEHNAWIEPN